MRRRRTGSWPGQGRSAAEALDHGRSRTAERDLCPGGWGDWVGPLIRIMAGLIAAPFTSRKFKTFVMTPNRNDLLFLKELVEAGKARPVIERRYGLSEVSDALRPVGEGHAQGQTVIRIAGE